MDRAARIANQDRLARVGTALFGTEWVSPLGRALNVGQRTIQRWASGETPVPDAVLASEIPAVLASLGPDMLSGLEYRATELRRLMAEGSRIPAFTTRQVTANHLMRMHHRGAATAQHPGEHREGWSKQLASVSENPVLPEAAGWQVLDIAHLVLHAGGDLDGMQVSLRVGRERARLVFDADGVVLADRWPNEFDDASAIVTLPNGARFAVQVRSSSNAPGVPDFDLVPFDLENAVEIRRW